MSLSAHLRSEFVLRFPFDAAEELERESAAAVAAEIGDLSPEARVALLDALPTARAAAAFELCDDDRQAALLRQAPPRLVLALLAPGRRRILERLPPAARRDLERLADLPEGAAGRLMDLVAVSCRRRLTVAEARESIRASGDAGTGAFYLVDAEGRLDGRVDAPALALATPETLLGALAHPTPAIPVTASREALADLLGRQRVDALPVVDAGHRLLGVVRYERLLEAAGEAASVDMQRMVGASADEQALSAAGFAVRRRMPWLHVNLLTAFLAAAVVALFEGVIARVTALAVLLPVVAGQSGNAGAQALAVTIRGLALHEIGLREWLRVTRKEALVGLANGVVLGIVCGGAVFFWSGSSGLGLVIGAAMALSVPAACVAGAVVPMLLTRLGQDPATASSIILTTVTDVVGFLTFLGLAALLLFLL